MRTLILILALAVTASAQTDNLKWIQIKEMSGSIAGHRGLEVNWYAAEIARRDDGVKLLVKIEFPWGSPSEWFQSHLPQGFDPTSIFRIQSRLDLDCTSRNVKPVTSSAEIWQFNGKRHKSKEHLFKSPIGLDAYFCEQGPSPTVAPRLKPIN